MPRKAVLALAGCSAIMTAGGGAEASPLFELAGAVNGQGGFNARAVDAGAASAYFNPAFLPDCRAAWSSACSASPIRSASSCAVAPSANADVPVGVGEHGDAGRRPLPTLWPADRVAGKWRARRTRPTRRCARDPDKRPAAAARPARVPGRRRVVTTCWDSRVGAGVYAMIPYSRFTGAAAFYSDEREQYFSNSLHPELYADRLTATSLSFGLGGRVHPRLSLGGAFTLSLRTVATTPTYLTDVGNFQSIVVDSKVDVSVALAPHFAAVYQLARGTRLSGTVHSPQKFEIVTDFSFLLSNGLEQSAALQFTHAYLPWMYGLGNRARLFAG